MTRLMLWLEIEQGKNLMYKEIFSVEIGWTTACVMREVTNTFVFKPHTCEKYDDTNEEMEKPENTLF